MYKFASFNERELIKLIKKAKVQTHLIWRASFLQTAFNYPGNVKDADSVDFFEYTFYILQNIKYNKNILRNSINFINIFCIFRKF